MKRTIIDASQLELNDKVVAIKRVSKTVKGGRTMRFSALVVVGLERPERFRKRSVRAKKLP